jgi:WD40 repeat protein
VGSWFPRKLALWDVATGSAIRGFEDRQEQGVYSVAVAPAARIGASGHHVGEDGEGLIHLWNLDTGKKIRTLTGHKGHVVALDFSPDGGRLVSVAAGKNGDGTARIWDVDSGEELVRSDVGAKQTLDERDAQGYQALHDVNFASDGETFLVAQTGHAAVLYDAKTGKVIRRFGLFLNGGAWTTAYSPDSRYAAAAGYGDFCTIRLFDLKTGNEVGQLSGHTANVSSIEFTPDGRHLVSGAADKTMRVWDVAAKKEVAQVLCHNHVTCSLAVSPAGQHVVSAGGVHQLADGHVPEDDYDIRVWQLPESVWPKESVGQRGE